jgi:peptide/nickel transport system ATP-binding protein/oligopeptide transport system ATP-binding protein
MAQDICAKQEPPLLQISRRHKVACHFAGERGSTGAVPITLDVLGCNAHGDPVPGATKHPDLGMPGYSTEYSDLETHRRKSAALADQ